MRDNSLRVNIERHPDVIDTINKILSAGSTAEVKREAGDTITVVRIDRRLLHKEKNE